MAQVAHAQSTIKREDKTPGDTRVQPQSLPPANTTRWVIRRKAAVVDAVRAGLISLKEACRRYALSEEEFRSWEKALDEHGLRGLRVTRLQEYRSSP